MAAGDAPGAIGTYGFGFLAGAGANREDLLEAIQQLDPSDAPWLTMCPKGTARHVVHEWLTDTLGATATAGAVEGGDWNYSTTTTRPVRLLNYTQIFRKDVSVSETQRAVNPAGMQDAYRYEVQKALKELSRNIELTVFDQGGGNATAGHSTATGADPGTPRGMKNFSNFLNLSANVGTYPFVPTSTATKYTLLFASASSSAANLTVLMFNNALEQAFQNGGNPDQAYVSPAIKRQISQFTATNQNRNIAAVEKKLVAAMDLYESDFGLIQIVLDRWVPQATNTTTSTAASDCRGNIYFLERASNRWAWLRPMQHVPVGKRGDSVAGMVLGEGTLEVLAPVHNVRIQGVNQITA